MKEKEKNKHEFYIKKQEHTFPSLFILLSIERCGYLSLLIYINRMYVCIYIN